MTRARPILLLLLLPPMLGELLSGNAPPLRFFQPLWFVILVLLYGCGTLVIRELAARWRLQWSVVFLAVAYAIVEEGLTTKAFFNPGWTGTGRLSAYGMYGGVQWVWAIGVTFAHATVSTLVPIAIVDLRWPELRHSPLLGRVGWTLSLAGLGGITLLGMWSIGSAEGGRTVPFHPSPTLLASAAATVALLCGLAYRFRGGRVHSELAPIGPPWLFFVAGFLAQAFFLVLPNELQKQGTPGWIAVAVELTAVFLALAFAFLQLLHVAATSRHATALILGVLAPYVLLTPVHEFVWKGSPSNPKTGMLAVGIGAALLLLAWRRAVLRGERGRP